MYQGRRIGAVIPALNEALSIAQVISAMAALQYDGQLVLDAIVVCDNGSDDDTARIAQAAGAGVVFEKIKGYGRACQRAVSALPTVDVIVFVDGDAQSEPTDILRILAALSDNCDFVLGSRCQRAEPGALLWQQRMGNWLAVKLISLLWHKKYTDLGPLRAITYNSYQKLNMSDQTYGFTIEMQIKAIQAKLNIKEIPVHYYKRIGYSKISGTWRAVFAGVKILTTIAQLKWQGWPRATK